MISDASPAFAYATFGQRSIAALIDAIPIAAAGGGVFAGYSLLGLDPGSRIFGVYLGVLAVGWGYCAGCESSAWQATIGKRLSGIVVSDLEGNALSFPAASLRYFAKTVSALPVLSGFLIAAFTPRSQALHDLLAMTVVLRRDRAPAAQRTVAPAVSRTAAFAAKQMAAPATSQAERATAPRGMGAAAGPLPGGPLASTAPVRPARTLPTPPAPDVPAPAAFAAPPPPAPAAPPAWQRPPDVVSLVGVDQAAATPGTRPPAERRQAREETQDRTVLIDAAYAPTVLVAARRGWTLRVTSGPDAGRSYDVGWEARIGREPDNTIRLSDEKASRHHAKIVQRPDGYVLTDLGSSNGTLVDGERIAEPRLLRPGAEITIGNTRLVLTEPGTKGR